MARISLIFLVFFCQACGEIERAELTVRPRQDDFASDIQPLLIGLGCGTAGGCHDVGLGDLLIRNETAADALDSSYLSVKRQLDRESPESSRLIQSVLAENPVAQHNPPACIQRDGCAYRKLVAWIAWDQEGDPRPSTIECDARDEGCFR